MTQLARKLRTLDYFTLGFGTMVGVGWLVLMDDWLSRGGPLGAILGFAIGGAALLPIGYTYARLVAALPEAGSEIAYTREAFGRETSFATGWVMMLAYLIVCPWEAVAISKMAAYLFPALNSGQLYRVAGFPVYLPQLAIGLALTALITGANYRGIRLSASFQNWMTFGLLSLFVVFVSLGFAKGAPWNLTPFFSHSGPVSFLLVLQIVPYFMTGFESAPKCAEESIPGFPARGFFKAIVWAILAGIIFYVLIIAVVAYIAPWKTLSSTSFATAVAFERAFGARWIVDLIIAAALFSLLKIFNGNFIAATRLLFALGRSGLVDARFGRIHVKNRTPSGAVLSLGLLTGAATLLGQSVLVPITEVGSLAAAIGWFAACAACMRLGAPGRERTVAALGALIASALILIKVLPFVPGHFSIYEYAALTVWLLMGAALRRSGPVEMIAKGIAG
jgi:basic amino acid/polyamine antiporter, APA family